VAFAILLAYATHGWYCTHVEQKRQFQSYDGNKKPADKPYSRYVDKARPEAGAIRTTAALFTSWIYAITPFAPATYSIPTFIAWTMAFSIFWDLHFFIVHKVVHENGTLYKWIHKLHHTHKQPGVFSAYYVTYQSHFFTEQSVVLLFAALGCPRNVFTWIMWYGTLATYVEHGGHNVDSVKMLSLPVLFEWVGTALGPWGLVLGGQTPGMHDWHHEKFTTNYGLSYAYLDKLFGSYHPGRVPGEAVGLTKKSEAAATPSSNMSFDADGVPVKKNMKPDGMTMLVNDDGDPM